MTKLNFWENILLSGSVLLLIAFLIRDGEYLYNNWLSLLGFILMVVAFRLFLIGVPKIIKRINEYGT